MVQRFFFYLLLLLPAISQAQEEKERYRLPDTIPFTIDSLYREDQFYIGFSFNLVTDSPGSISQEGFSGGLHLGFIRDMPLNDRRNVALGLGLGWSINSYGQNLFIGKDENNSTIFRSLEEDQDYDTNRFTTQVIEAPIELRWRTSTAETYKFWRIYTGLRLGYIYNFRSNYTGPEEKIVVNDIEELNRFRLGATFTFGYNTFNFQFYYALNPFFNNAEVGGAELSLSTLQIGLNFYIL